MFLCRLVPSHGDAVDEERVQQFPEYGSELTKEEREKVSSKFVLYGDMEDKTFQHWANHVVGTDPPPSGTSLIERS